MEESRETISDGRIIVVYLVDYQKIMTRGGKRVGAGSKPKWNSGKTKTIRVPEALADRALEIIQSLDNDESLTIVHHDEKKSIIDSDTESKIIDLSGVTLRQVNGVLSVYLEDLALIGYRFKPERITHLVEARLQKLELERDFKHGNNQKRR
jgi:hypothetical protein